MAFEVGEPPEVAGVPYTNYLAESDDLLEWRLVAGADPHTKDRYSACPALRFVNDWYYMIYLEHRPGPTYETHVVRSRDLTDWETSPLNPILRHSPEDRRVANSGLTPEQQNRIAGAVDLNNSDVDLCEFEGRVVLYYSWGNQKGIEHLAEAVYHGTLADLFHAFFPDDA